jgi:hypothetical protein
MKNVKETMLKKCITIDFDTFKNIIEEIYKNEKIEMSIEEDGLYAYYESGEAILGFELSRALSEYFDINVESFHTDRDYDYPSVWVVYH